MTVEFEFSSASHPMGEESGVRCEPGSADGKYCIQFFDKHYAEESECTGHMAEHVYRWLDINDAKAFHRNLGAAIASLEALS